MRALLTSILLIAIFTACKKTGADPKVPKILLDSIANDGVGNPVVFNVKLEYDSQDRLTRVLKYYNERLNLDCNIRYNSNTIIVDRKGYSITKDEVIYTLGLDGLPSKRTRIFFTDQSIWVYGSNAKVYDTTNYEYNAAGVLTKTTRTGNSSTNTLNAGIWENSSFREINTIIYNNEGGRLQNSFSKSLISSVFQSAFKTVYSTSTAEESFTYEYTKLYPNKMDYSNMVVLNECVFSLFEKYPMNKNYSHLPDKMSGYSQRINDDGSGDVLITYTGAADIIFDTNGYLWKITGLPYPYFPANTASFNYKIK